MLDRSVQKMNIVREDRMPVVNDSALTDLVIAMMRGAGSAEGEARAIAENLVQANLMGHDSHGVGLAPRYMDHAQKGTLTVGAEVTMSGVRSVARCGRWAGRNTTARWFPPAQGARGGGAARTAILPCITQIDCAINSCNDRSTNIEALKRL